MTSSAEYSKVGPRGARRPPKSEWLWLRESAAWLASCLLLVCIVVILNVYQNKPRPTLHWGITLNALIAIIIKLGLAFLIVPLSAAVGQWKWMRVRTSRSLEEFSAISDAAQSPWASIMLLVRFRGGIIAATGAILVLSTQAIETFVQQSVKYPLSAIPVDVRATLPISDYFRSQAPASGSYTPPDFSMKAAVYNGLFATTPNTPFPVTPACSGVNCTWENFYTLGFCNTCTNITDQIQINKAATKYSLPDGLILSPGDPDTGEPIHNYNASLSGASSVDGDSGGVGTLDYALEMTFLALWYYQTNVMEPNGVVNQTGQVQPTAAKCTMRLCAKEFVSAALEGSHLRETQAPGAATSLSFADPDVLPQSNLTFTADYLSWEGFAYWLNTSISGTYFSPTDFGETYDAKTDSRDAIFQVLIGARESLTVQSLFDNVASSLTRAMRMENFEIDGGPGPVANGTTYIAETVVKVEWAWLSLPFALWALVLLYLITMVFMSRGLPSWKDSTIATLCHGLDDHAMKDVASLQSNAEMEDKAKEMRVKLANRGKWIQALKDWQRFCSGRVKTASNTV